MPPNEAARLVRPARDGDAATLHEALFAPRSVALIGQSERRRQDRRRAR